MSNPSAIATALQGGPSPFVFPAIWDSISLGGGLFTWSGRVQIHGAKRAYNWQIKTPPGIEGEVYTYRGYKSHPFRMRLEVWTDFQWQLLPGLLEFFTYNAVKPNPNGTANPIEIYHPALTALDITQVICMEIVAPEIDQEHSGAAWWEFVLREYRPALLPVNITVTPVAAPIVITNVPGGTVGAQIAAQNAAVAALGTGLGSSLP